MDPWNCDSSSTLTASSQNLELAKQVFENSFLAGDTSGRLDKPVCDSANTARLTDSHLYISKLEERLTRLQQCGEATGSDHNSSGRKPEKGAQLSEQLRQAKEDALIRLVRSNSTTVVEEEDFQLEEELTTSYLYRRLAPQKIALTKGEKVLLLAADQLAIKLAESDISDSTDTSDDRRNTSEDALEEN